MSEYEHELDAVRKGKRPFTTGTNGGSLGLLCNTLRMDESLEMIITRSLDGWHVAVTFPDGIVRTGTANTVHNALWMLMRAA